jgi:pSer/pThr/pTyr-binding forkhead associated (FHA) protein
VSRDDDKTKMMRTPAGDAETATPPGGTDRTQAVPASGADERTRALPGKTDGADERTRAMPTSDPSPEGTTRIAGTPVAGDATAVIQPRPSAPDATVGLGAAADATAEAPLDDDVTIVRPHTQRRPRLLVRGADGQVQEHTLGEGEVTIGRASSCTLVLANPEVSRSHARIVTGFEGAVLHVVGQRRNTLVNGEVVTGERPLRHGDVVELASERVLFAETAETPSFDTAEPAPPPRSYTIPALAGVAVVALALVAYLLGSRSQPPPPPPPVAAQAPAVVAPAAPAVDPAQQAAQAAAAAAAAREAATAAVREVAEREAAAHEVTQRQDRISKLLYEGDIALLEKRLTTPPDGSAFYAYSEALKLDPENQEARTKIASIIDTYLGWAESARARGNSARARLYADKAGYIHAQAPTAGDAAEITRRVQALGGSIP